jgi:ferredoxin-NADP reductase
LTVADKVPETDDIASLILRSPDGSELPSWTPGAHIDVRLPSGLIRQYSLNGDHRDRTSYRIGVLRDENTRGGSMEIHRFVTVGTKLEIAGPRNRFDLQPAESYLFIAGGIGITPILPMIAQAEKDGSPWRLVYGARSRRAMAYTTELLGRTGGSVTLVPQDEQGFPDLDAVLARAGTAPGLVYACGPAVMLARIEELAERTLRAGQLRLERFTAPPEGAELPDENLPFELHLARTGVTAVVGPDQTTLDVILEHVPDYLYGCQEGYCGTCIAAVASGTPLHRDFCLEEGERRAGTLMTPCVSRAASAKLILDI